MNALVLFKICFAAVLLDWAQQYIMSHTKKVECEGRDEPCWIWTAGHDGRYGHAYLMGQRIKSHILSFIAFGKKLKRKHVVDHLCHRTKCCQPAHLESTTQSGNIARCFAEGRGRSPFLKEVRDDAKY